MSTFVEEETNSSNTRSKIQPEAITDIAEVKDDGTKPTTPWATWISNINSKYQERIKRAAQQSNHMITLRYEDGKKEKQVYTRMKLLQWQYDELEDLRNEATELGANNKPRESALATKRMYTKASAYILFNTKTERPMTEDEYKHCEFADVRPALDAAMLLGLVTDPN